jgi:hypothetical protein
MSSPGRAFHAASNPADAIIVATAPSITPRRPTRAATERIPSSAAIVPPAKIAVIVRAER